MKHLMSGNEATARGVYEAGIKVCSAYPGTPSTEILENLPQYGKDVYCEWAPNEKVAAEVAYGASIAGVRSMCAMKHVGVNVAADPIFTAAYNGITGGFVIVSADDPSMHSSQNEQDNRHYALAAKLPMVEPSDSQECLDFMKAAYQISEQFDLPVLFRTTTRVSHSKSLVCFGERTEQPVPPYARNTRKYISSPANAYLNHPKVEAALTALEEYGCTSPLNRMELNGSKIGVITASIAYEYAKDAFPADTSFLKLGLTNPLPMKLIREFASKVEKLYVIEELDSFMEDQIKAAGIDCIGKELTGKLYELNPQLLKERIFGEKPERVDVGVAAVSRPPALCPGCPHRATFFAIKKLGLTVFGDIGCYTLCALPPIESMDATLCMGASIGMAIGAEKAHGRDFSRRSVAVLGDSTFIHSGITGLINAVYDRSNINVIILDNRITGMTGHQQNPATGFDIHGNPAPQLNLEAVCEAVGAHVRVVNPMQMKDMEQALREETQRDGVSVIIARYPCALLDKRPKQPCTIADCHRCGACLRLGCPALERGADGAVRVNAALCNGCGLCKQMCAFGCITGGGEKQ